MPKIAVIDTFPSGLNSNPMLPRFLCEGFAGIEAVAKHAYPETASHLIPALQPDLVVFMGSVLNDWIDYWGLARLSRESGAHVAFWLHDDPYEFDAAFRAVECADTIFSNDRYAVEHYIHPRVHHLPMAASSQHFRELDPAGYAARPLDLLFCGVAFPNRVQMIRDLAPDLARFAVRIAGKEWPEDLRGMIHPPIPHRELPDSYASAKFALNLGRSSSLANERYHLGATTPGPRTFEAAMAGCVQLYFAGSLEIEDYYEPDREIVLFDSPGEVMERLGDCEKRPGYYAEIAGAAQRRTQRDHTYAVRARRILDVCLG